MGTRGLRIVRFRGRYFVTYSNYDSYLSGLGKGTLESIPTDRKQYKEWLQAERQYYARQTEALETEVLTVSAQKLQDVIQEDDMAAQDDLRPSPEPSWRDIVGDLYELPTGFCDIFNNLYVEYTYLIDLDEEMFAVNNWIFFDLWNVPRDRWISAFTEEENGEERFSFKTCPEGFDDVEPPPYIATSEENERLSAMYQRYKVELRTPSSGPEFSMKTPPEHLIAVLTFARLIRQYDGHYHDIFPKYEHDSFAFREFVFAIVSLATGQFYFDRMDRYAGRHDVTSSDGFLVDKRRAQQPSLMPIFGSGSHSHDQEPGSAPAQDIYWFRHVLVSLVTDLAFDEDLEPAVAKAVEWASDQDRPSFHGVLCSGLRVVYLEVCSENGITQVQRSEPVALSSACRPHHPRRTVPDTGNTMTNPFAELERDHRGFRTLQNFFQSAAMRVLKGFGRGRLPVEVYANILTHVDRSSRIMCGDVSGIFHTICMEQFHFAPELMLLKYQDSTGFLARAENERWSRTYVYDLRDFGLFTFQDLSTGAILQSQLSHGWGKGPSQWCPIIGPSTRPSMITAVQLELAWAS